MNWDDLRSYLGTWSSLHSYKVLFAFQLFPAPERLISVKAKHEDGEELVSSFLSELKEAVRKESGHEGKEPERIELEWPVTLILARKGTASS